MVSFTPRSFPWAGGRGYPKTETSGGTLHSSPKVGYLDLMGVLFLSSGLTECHMGLTRGYFSSFSL